MIITKLKNLNNTDYQYLYINISVQPKIYKNSSIDKKMDFTTNDMIAKGLAKTFEQVIRKINNRNKPEWFEIEDE